MTLNQWRVELDARLNNNTPENINSVQPLLIGIPPGIDKRIACTPAQLEKLAELNGSYNYSQKLSVNDTVLDDCTYEMFLLTFNNVNKIPHPNIWNAKTYGNNDDENRILFREKLSCWCYENFFDCVKIKSEHGDSDSPDDLLEEKFAAMVSLDNVIEKASNKKSLADILTEWRNNNLSHYDTLSKHRDWSGAIWNMAGKLGAIFKPSITPIKPTSQQLFDDALSWSASIVLKK